MGYLGAKGQSREFLKAFFGMARIISQDVKRCLFLNYHTIL
jgi:hypothetical protein